MMCFPLALECDSSSDNRLGGSALLGFTQLSLVKLPGRSWSSMKLLQTRCGPFFVTEEWQNWPSLLSFCFISTLHSLAQLDQCHRNSPALSVAISTAVLLESSLLRKCSTVFSAGLNFSPYPGTDQISPAQQGLLWPSQIELMAPLSSKVEGEPLLTTSTRPFSSFISGPPVG